MRAQGIQIVEGFLIVPVYRAVPDCFWSRLQHLIDRAGLRDEYRAERNASGKGPGAVWEREERLFRAWTLRAYGTPPLWPWERGWTQEEADVYLDPIARAA